MKKDNLILTHSFPTNSILLRGLIEYLEDYFNVFFIDLPGFTKAVPPLKTITLEGFYKYASDKIEEFALDNYIIGGISFGFSILNNLNHDNKCKGILAIAPFLGRDSLRMSLPKKIAYALFIKGSRLLNLETLLWSGSFLRTYLPKLRGYPPGAIDIMMDEIDAHTFFDTANLLLGQDIQIIYHDTPYVLIANEDDRSVDFQYIHKTLKKNVNRLLVVKIPLEHYPQEISKEYFTARFPQEDIRRILDFLAD